jgi:chromatin segregation and condensation protein Rec8/ScpA/Scc1 (kleisin family)
VSILDRMAEILELLRHTWSILFSSVAGAERVRTEWVVTLLALLELVRLGQARAGQAELFGEIAIERPAAGVKRSPEMEAPGPAREIPPAEPDGAGPRPTEEEHA